MNLVLQCDILRAYLEPIRALRAEGDAHAHLPRAATVICARTPYTPRKSRGEVAVL